MMLQKKYLKITFMIVFFSLILAGTRIASSKEINTLILQTPVIDGVINSGEYDSSKSLAAGNYQLSWELIDNTSISIGIVAKTTGWVAIGFDPTTQMKDADIIFAWVEANCNVVIIDAFSLVATGANHPADTDLGGTDDILSYNGTENATHTSIEFIRLLSTGDANDKVIPMDGDIDIIWAYGPADNFSDYHGGGRGSSTMTISTSQETTATTDLATTTTQDDKTTTTTENTPGFQGFLAVISLSSLILIHNKKQ